MSLLLLEQPDFQLFNFGFVSSNFVIGFDHQSLRFDWRSVPPPGKTTFSPEHAQFVFLQAAFCQAGQDRSRSRSVSGSMQRDCQMSLRLAVAKGRPMFLSLPNKVVVGGFVFRFDRFIVQKETTPVEIEADRLGQVVVVQFFTPFDVVIAFGDPPVESIERSECRSDIDFCSELAKPAESGGYIKRDVVVGSSAREPWPCSIAKLHLRKLIECLFGFVGHSVLVEQDSNVSASLAFFFTGT